MARLPPEVSAALRRAGSRALPPAPRAVLLRRLARYGYDADRCNVGGIRDGGWGNGDTLATFADLDSAAARLVELSRILAGEHPWAASQGFDMGAADGGGSFFSLAPEHGEKPLEISHWSQLMPGDRSGDRGSPGYEVGAVGDIRPRRPRPAAYHVLFARHHARERARRLPALAGSSTDPELVIDLASMEGLFGPSDAASAAFLDIAAAWRALEEVPAATKLPGWKTNHAAWVEFARAWKAGDNASPQCNGDCEAGLRGQLLTLNTMRDDVTKIAPEWGTHLARDLSLDSAKGRLWALAEEGLETIDKRAPALGWFGRFLMGTAPRWQYGLAAAGGVLAAGAVVRSYLPRGSR